MNRYVERDLLVLENPLEVDVQHESFDRMTLDVLDDHGLGLLAFLIVLTWVQSRAAKRKHDEIESRPLILAVDDSKTVQKIISTVLEKESYRVSAAEDGLAAIAKLDEEMPKLILLDITMPRMDGYQVCKVITGNEAFKHIPVVMLSGKDGFFDKVRGRMVVR